MAGPTGGPPPPTPPQPPQPPQPPAYPQYPPPGAPQWGYGPPQYQQPPRSGRASPVVIVLIVVVVLGLIGGGAVAATQLLSAGKEPTKAAEPSIDPELGEPSGDDETAPTPEPTPEGDLIGEPEPERTPEPLPPPDETGGGPDDSSQSTGVPIGAGISVRPAPGWGIVKQSPDFVALDHQEGASATFGTVQAGQGTSAEAILGEVTNNASKKASSFRIYKSGTFDPGKSSIVSTAWANYLGTWPTQQGSIELNGGVTVFVRQDGVAAIIDTWTVDEQPALDRFAPDWIAMIESVVQSM